MSTQKRRLRAAAEDEWDADLAGMHRLHELARRMIGEAELQPMLEEILEAGVDISGAGRGTLQLIEPGSWMAHIRAHWGFARPFLKFFDRVAVDDDACCAEVLRSGTRKVVPDIESSPLYTKESRQGLRIS